MLLPGVSETSQKTQQLVDEEVQPDRRSGHREVLDLLRDTRASSMTWSRRCSRPRRSTRQTRTRPPD